MIEIASVLSAIASKWTILVAILFFGIIIMVHEGGHFAFAKLFKVKVNEFSLGMGPKIISRKKGDTAYSWRLFPIGGYVAMEGEDGDSEDDNSFAKKPCWQRIIIVAAGAFINILLGLIIVAIMLSTSSDALSGTSKVNFFYKTASSSSAQTEQTANMYGLKTGDTIKKVDGKNVLYYEDVYYLIQRDTNSDGKVDITVNRDGKVQVISGVKTDVINNMVMVGVNRSFVSVVKDTFKESACIIRMVWLSLFDLVTGKYSVKDLSGPIGVVDYVSKAAQASQKSTDFTPLLKMMALITINIGLFNLLPIPALDGGRIFFLLVELIRRKQINQKHEALVHAIGMVLLLVFMVLISAKDIWTLITGG